MFWFASIILLGVVHGETVPPTPDRHITLHEWQVAGKDIHIVGDVHGCYDEMLEVLRRAGAVNLVGEDIKEGHIVILAGDVLNKGPKNHQALRWAMNHGAYHLYGNHEINVLTKPENYAWTWQLTQTDVDYLYNVPHYTVRIPKYDVIVVHAGFMPDIPLTDQTEFTMTRIRNIQEVDGVLVPRDDTKKGVQWSEYQIGPDMNFFGHDAGRGKDADGNPIIQYLPWATGLDSRCVYGGKLSVMTLSEDPQRHQKLTQVDCPAYDAFYTSDVLEDIF